MKKRTKSMIFSLDVFKTQFSNVLNRVKNVKKVFKLKFSRPTIITAENKMRKDEILTIVVSIS